MRVVQFLGPATGGIGVHAGSLSDDLRAQGIQVRQVTAPLTASTFGWNDALPWWPAGIGDMGRLRRFFASADVIHAHGLRAGVLAAIAAGPTPVVVSLHNEAPAGGRWQSQAMLALVARRARLVTGASNDLVEWARAAGARASLAMVPSPLVPTLLAAPEISADFRDRAGREFCAAEGIRPGLPIVLAVARVAPQKRIDVMIEVAQLLKGIAHVVLVGSADESLKDSLAGFDEHLTYLGPRTDLDVLYLSASALLVTSTWEARALVVQEALAAGLPAVVTDTGGLPDLVGHGRDAPGAVCPVGDAAALARAVERIVTDRDEANRMGRAGRERAATWPDREESASEWISRYSRAIGL